MQRIIKRLQKKLLQFSECEPKRRGRSLSNPNPKDEKSGDICSQKRKSDGKVLYYRSSKVVAEKKKSSEEKKKIKKSKKRQLSLASKKKIQAKKAKAKEKEQKTQAKKAKLFAKAGDDKTLIEKIKSGEIKTFKGLKVAQGGVKKRVKKKPKKSKKRVDVAEQLKGMNFKGKNFDERMDIVDEKIKGLNSKELYAVADKFGIDASFGEGSGLENLRGYVALKLGQELEEVAEKPQTKKQEVVKEKVAQNTEKTKEVIHNLKREELQKAISIIKGISDPSSSGLDEELADLKGLLEDMYPKKEENKVYSSPSGPASDYKGANVSNEELNESLREFYSSTYFQHHGMCTLEQGFNHLQKMTGISRQDAKLQLLELKNEGKISLVETIDLVGFENRDIIKDFRRNYFAFKINDLMEF